ncbi:MAG: Sarcosine oxidase subunit alpha, partial [Alphaproteobacteria bacterium MarineAlpha9_Bin7]
MSQTNRIPGGLIERNRTLNFKFNRRNFEGHPGDTLASALLANGQQLIGRSFKYHRPRGIVSAGSEEPNALVQLRRGAHQEPNTRATEIELFEGLEATSQNHLGPLKYDFMAVNDLLSPFLTAGFYYKTFMWPKIFWEKIYEPAIRASAGLGRLSIQPDPDTYDKGFLHCDVLIIGGGPSGLSAALAAGRSGARVIIADENFRMGGRLIAETLELGGMSGTSWVSEVLAELSTTKNLRVMPRTTVYGAFDHGIYGALEHTTDHLSSNKQKPRQVLWKIYSKRAILCTGATERLIAFGNNDRPGVMLAGATRAYVNRWSVTPGKRIAVFTNNDDGWRTATDLVRRNVEVTAVVDTRDGIAHATPRGTSVVMGGRIIDTKGRRGIRSFTLSNGHTVPADCLAVSGGWSPNIHLTCHQGARPVWRDDIAAFVPDGNLPAGMTVAGAANGSMGLATGIAEGVNAANLSIQEMGFSKSSYTAPVAEDEPSAASAFWYVKESRG